MTSMRIHHTTTVPSVFEKVGDEFCTGCAACANVCPNEAIDMALTANGFYRPVRISNTCNDCSLCANACANTSGRSQETTTVRPSEEPQVYAAWSTDPDVHVSSSSGGAFSELARYVLDLGGVVCSCEWGSKFSPRHVIIEKWSDIHRLRGSKYLPSLINRHVLRELIMISGEGRKVLFCGTPCQVAGLARIIPASQRCNFLLVEFVCHGVPSLRSFLQYIRWRFGALNKIKSFSFRNKRGKVPGILAVDETGKDYRSTLWGDT